MNKKFFRGLWRLIRPYWWGKTFFFMSLGAAMAVEGFPDLGRFLLGFLIMGVFLWGGFYTLNDLTDIKLDVYDKEKKNRAIASGMVSPKRGFIFAYALIIIALMAGFFVNRFFFYMLVVLTINHLAYTLEPIRLKKRIFFDVFSGAFMTPVFRFLAGWFLFTDSFEIPILMIIALSFLKVGGYMFYKLRNRDIEIKFKHRNTFTLLSEKSIKIISVGYSILGLVSFILMPLIGTLPLRFLWLIGAIFVITPFYWRKYQQTKGVFSIQKYVYLSYFLAGILFMLIYSL